MCLLYVYINWFEIKNGFDWFGIFWQRIITAAYVETKNSIGLYYFFNDELDAIQSYSLVFSIIFPYELNS